jgi:hypothetical protein
LYEVSNSKNLNSDVSKISRKNIYWIAEIIELQDPVEEQFECFPSERCAFIIRDTSLVVASIETNSRKDKFI